jgi:AbrB family looped-hinge helix DNA binding protein
MRLTSKGQVTIPLQVRDRLGLLPHTEVEFEVVGDHARIRKARSGARDGLRARLAIETLRGTADGGMTTDEIMALTRGPRPPRRRRK